MKINNPNLSLDEISGRIADAILEERFLNKKSITERVRPILNIWLKRADSVKKHKSKSVTVHKLQWTIEKTDVDQRFWLNLFRKEIGLENMQPYYDAQKQHLKDEGYFNYEKPKD